MAYTLLVVTSRSRVTVLNIFWPKTAFLGSLIWLVVAFAGTTGAATSGLMAISVIEVELAGVLVAVGVTIVGGRIMTVPPPPEPLLFGVGMVVTKYEARVAVNRQKPEMTVQVGALKPAVFQSELVEFEWRIFKVLPSWSLPMKRSMLSGWLKVREIPGRPHWIAWPTAVWLSKPARLEISAMAFDRLDASKLALSARVITVPSGIMTVLDEPSVGIVMTNRWRAVNNGVELDSAPSGARKNQLLA